MSMPAHGSPPPAGEKGSISSPPPPAVAVKQGTALQDEAVENFVDCSVRFPLFCCSNMLLYVFNSFLTIFLHMRPMCNIDVPICSRYESCYFRVSPRQTHERKESRCFPLLEFCVLLCVKYFPYLANRLRSCSKFNKSTPSGKRRIFSCCIAREASTSCAAAAAESCFLPPLRIGRRSQAALGWT